MAKIAHGIDTPVQFVSDSLQFLSDSWQHASAVIADLEAVCLDGRGDPGEIRARICEAKDRADLAYLRERVPVALERTNDGLARVGAIVRAMRDFGRPEQNDQAPADLNKALRSTLIVAQNPSSNTSRSRDPLR